MRWSILQRTGNFRSNASWLFESIMEYDPFPKSWWRVCWKNYQITFLDLSGWKLSRFKPLLKTITDSTESYPFEKQLLFAESCLLISATIGNKHTVSETNPSSMLKVNCSGWFKSCSIRICNHEAIWFAILRRPVMSPMRYVSNQSKFKMHCFSFRS